MNIHNAIFFIYDCQNCYKTKNTLERAKMLLKIQIHRTMYV